MPQCLLLPALLCALGSVPAFAEGRGAQAPEALPYFDGPLDQLLEECAERNAPLLILCCKEGEEASDRFRDALLDNGSLARDLGAAAVLLVNDGEHPRTRIQRRNAEGKREKIEVCSAFHTATCEVHRRNWNAVYQRFLSSRGDGSWPLPSALVIAPEGSLVTLIFTGQPPGDDAMSRAVAEVQRSAGPAVAAADLAALRSLAGELKRRVAAQSWPEAWHTCDALLALAPAGRHAKAAQALRPRIEEGLVEALAAYTNATASIDERYAALARFAESARGTPIEKQAAAARARLARDPKLDPEVVRRVGIEIEAEQLLTRARGLLRAGDERGAKRLLKKLAGKKYRGTKAAREAEQLAREKHG